MSLILLTAYKNRWGVLGTCIASDTMLQRSDQLLLSLENDHFEGSMQTESMMHIMVLRWRGGSLFKSIFQRFRKFWGECDGAAKIFFRQPHLA